MAIALFMNAATYRRSLGRGEAFSGSSQTGMFARSPHGWVHGVPDDCMDAGGRAKQDARAEKGLPPAKASPATQLRPFMNNATRYWDTSTGPNVTARD